MERAGTHLDRALRRAGIEPQVRGVQAQAAFAEAIERQLGRDARRQARARSLRDGVLTVAVTSGGLASEIQLHHESLIAAVNEKLKTPAVTRLRLVL